MKTLDDMTEQELKALFIDIATVVKAKLPEGTGFVVLATPMGTGGVAQYVSNVDRSSASKWMLETVERWARNAIVER